MTTESTEDKKRGLTRRAFLRGSAALVSSGLICKGYHAHGAVPALAQVAPKRIYIAPDDHTDYMWTADAETYRRAFLDMLDYYLDQADATAGNPLDFQSRWNCDGSFWIWTYENNRTPAQFQRLIDRIRDGHISFPLNALVVCLGGAPAEAVLRGMYYAGTIERRFGLRVPLAVAMENQTLPYGLGALWAGSGVRYSWKGICDCATRVPAAWDRQHDIYWMKGPDGSRVLMKWNSQLISSEAMGGYAEARDPDWIVEYVDTDSDFVARYPYRVIGAFGQGWDNLATTDQSFVRAAQAKTNASRRVVVSNQVDFFEDFESTYGKEIATQACSYGNEWDLYCASMAEVSARVKRAVEKLRSAEAMAALVSLQDAGFMRGRQEARKLAWMALGLYWEHDWTADGPVSRDARRNWQRQIAAQIEGYVESLHADAAAALGRLIQKSGSGTRFYAFNPLSWARTDIADLAYSDTGAVQVIDLSTGQEVPSQFVTVGGQTYLRVLAEDVPPIGYKVFEVREGGGKRFPGGPSADALTGRMENGVYEITVAGRGAVTSLIDRTRDRRDFAGNIDDYYINDLGPGSGTLAVEDAGPVSVTLRATGARPLEHSTRITLIRGHRRIDIRNDITQGFEDTHTWAFGFSLENPDVWHEEVGAVIRARLLADGGHYAPRNARYDWLTLNHFADISGDDSVGVTLSNADCYFMRLGQSTTEFLDTGTAQVSPLVGGQVDGEWLGIPRQGGDTRFMQRFALQTHGAYDPVMAMRFALEHQNPLVTGVVVGGSAYPETLFSSLTISDPSVLLWALKPAEEGIDQGIVVRVWNLSGKATSGVSLSCGLGGIEQAVRTTHIETPIEAAKVTDGALIMDLNAHQLKTFSVQLGELAGKEEPPSVQPTATPGATRERHRRPAHRR